MHDDQTITLDDLLRNPDNANLGTDAGREALARGIDEVGFLDGGVMSSDNVVLSGNHRLDEAKKRGAEPIIVDYDGTRPVFLRRTNVESGSPEAEKIALLSNQVPRLNYNPDRERIGHRLVELKIVPEQVAFTVEELQVVPVAPAEAPSAEPPAPVKPAAPNEPPPGGADPASTNEKVGRLHTVTVECPNEEGQERVYQMLIELGINKETGFKVTTGNL